MKKKIIVIFLILFLLSAGVVSAIRIDIKQLEKIKTNTESNSNDDFSEYNKDSLLEGRNMITLINQLDSDLMTEYLEELTDIGPRSTCTKGCEEAAEYIYNKYDELGLDVRYHNWTNDAFSSKNIEATLKGSDESSDEIYIICGHYDSVPESVGADDNGCGTVSVLAAAKVLSQYKFKHDIRFVLFSGEEQGLYGSYHYAVDSAKNKDNIEAVLNIDMTGYASNIEDGGKVKVFENIRSKWISEKTVEISEKYQDYINLDVEVARIYFANSDHFRFWQNGYDSIFYYESNKNPDFHTPQDNMNTVNITYATRIAKLALATIADLSEISTPIKGKKHHVGGEGSGNYTKITHALKHSTNGDIIYVYPGTYNEKITINKSIDIISKEEQKTTITFNQPKPVIKIHADYCYISGFKIQNTCNTQRGPGIDLYSNYCTIIKNNISDNTGYGIGLISAKWNDLFYNHIENNTNGVMLWRVSPYNRLHNNKITNNRESGVTLSAKSDYTSIKHNKLSFNLYGIYTQVGGKDETVGNPTYTNVYNNNITNNRYGIYLNILSTKNEIIFNNINKNKVGIYIGEKCKNNKILRNNFIENDIHATFESVIFNIWLKNHWDNRTLNFGPKLIKGYLKSIPFIPKLVWFNIDLLPKRTPHEITL